MHNIRILIADDHSVVRAGLVAILGYQGGLSVVGEAANGAEAIQMANSLNPDLVIMDLMMPGIDGAQATRSIHTQHPEIKILILTNYGCSADVKLALENGASGAILKDVPDEELISAIRTVASGEKFITKQIKQMMVDTTPLRHLTDKQRLVLESLTRGLTNADIARQLGVSVSAVKQHLNSIFAKLGASNRSEAASIALKKLLIKI